MSTWIDKTPDLKSPDAQTADVVFKLDCKRLPVDHATELAYGVCQRAPWLADLPNCAIHSVHVAGSQNGWTRPDAHSGEWLELSKRTRLRIRVPLMETARLIENLSHSLLTIDGEPLHILEGKVKTLTAGPTLFSRYAAFQQLDDSADEDQFLAKVIETCESVGFTPNKLMCGRTQSIASNNGPLLTRSVLLADVPDEASVKLQDTGIGDYRLLGCGILIPHKDTDAVN